MSEQAELSFVKSFTSNLASHPVTYSDDFQQPPSSSLKKIPILPVDLPPPPERKPAVSAPSSSINITFKSLKPAQSYTISVQPTDTISDIKSQLAAKSGAPPADAQRLLLKGKALADAKLLQEYSVKDGDVVNLMVKPGFEWDPSKATAVASSPSSGSITLVAEQKTRAGHSRIPSVVLSPSPSLNPSPGEKIVDIPLMLDTSAIPSVGSTVPNTTYHTTLAQPDFWEHLHSFLASEFGSTEDAASAWEDFFRASKGTLSASEIAKIRDSVGVIGMAGT